MLELQKLDCNCNDCIFMVRNQDKFKHSLEFQNKMQLDYFTTLKNKLIQKAKEYKDRFNDLENWDRLLTESEKMKYQFDKSVVSINYGYCDNFKKDVSFIPNTCQLHTKDCFKHRKDK
jgi:hypothetical protein